jgi:hypothetical protein
MKVRISMMIAAIFGLSLLTHGQGDAKEAITQIKQNLAASVEKLKGYEWLETTTVFKDGEQKSKTQNQCYYSVDNKLIKVPTGNSQKAKTPGGLKGKVAQNKKADIKDYVTDCLDKIHQYLPPDGEKLQANYAAGKTSLQVLEPHKKFNVDFSDYLQPGDKFGVQIDKEKNLLTAVNVNTYVDKPDDKIGFKLTYGQLPDGTQYPAETLLDLPAKKLKIVITNEGYKKGGGK